MCYNIFHKTYIGNIIVIKIVTYLIDSHNIE